MSDNKLPLSTLLTQLADNTTQQILSQTIRNFLVSVYGNWYQTTIVYADSPYTATTNDVALYCNTSGGDIDVYLDVTNMNGRFLAIINTDVNSTIIRVNGGTIDGQTSLELVAQNSFVLLTCMGTDYKIISQAYQSTVTTAVQDIHSYRTVGGYYTIPAVNAPLTGSTWLKDIIYAAPVVIANEITIDQLSIYVSATGNATKSRLAIYTSDTTAHIPLALVVDAGEVDISTTGQKTVSIPATTLFSNKIYWFTQLFDADTPDVEMISIQAEESMQILGFSVTTNPPQGYSRYDIPYTYGAYPKALPTGSLAVGGWPAVWFRRSA